MPTAARGIHGEHAEAFIVAELERTRRRPQRRYRSPQQLFEWLDEGEIDASAMAKMRPPKLTDKPVPVLSDDQVRALLAGCTGKDFRNRRDGVIIRLFLDTGMRLEEMRGLRCTAGDSELSAYTRRILTRQCHGYASARRVISL